MSRKARQVAGLSPRLQLWWAPLARLKRKAQSSVRYMWPGDSPLHAQVIRVDNNRCSKLLLIAVIAPQRLVCAWAKKPAIEGISYRVAESKAVSGHLLSTTADTGFTRERWTHGHALSGAFITA